MGFIAIVVCFGSVVMISFIFCIVTLAVFIVHVVIAVFFVFF